MTQWHQIQLSILKKTYNLYYERDLQEINAYLDETRYHYLIPSLFMTRTGTKFKFKDKFGNTILKKNICQGLDYDSSSYLDILTQSQAENSSDVIVYLLFKDEIDYEGILTYSKDTLIRFYLNNEELPPILLGYQTLIQFISNLDINGYIMLENKSNYLGLDYKCGIMGKTKNKEGLRNIFNETKKGI